MWLRPDQITNTEAVCFVEEEEEVVANAKFRPNQIARNPWEDRLKYNRGDIQLSVT